MINKGTKRSGNAVILPDIFKSRWAAPYVLGSERVLWGKVTEEHLYFVCCQDLCGGRLVFNHSTVFPEQQDSAKLLQNLSAFDPIL